MYHERLQTTLPAVRDRIESAARRSGRAADDVTLVAVTKTHPLEAIDAALDAGLVDLGENRVSELEEKVAARPDCGARWHMIGTVQSRKAARLIGVADLVHSVDRAKIAEKISRALPDGGEMRVLVQVNTSGEEAKSGFEGAAVEDGVLGIAALPGIRVEGLMTMAPFVDDEAVLRPAFAKLRELLAEVRRQDPGIGPVLSMGMTNDLEIAIEEGATMVRIGTALFGERTTAPA